MTQAAEVPTGTRLVYLLEGTLLEACSCNVLCPCWIGEDPDGGTCDAFVSYHFNSGVIEGVDVSGLNIANVVQIPGNVLAGNWRVVIHVDKRATPQQKEALLNALGTGTLSVPGVLEATMEPFRNMTGDVTTLRDSVFSTVPGSPAWVGKATHHKVTLRKYGMEWEFEGRNAIQSEYRMEYRA
jgi:hypothetical protein